MLQVQEREWKQARRFARSAESAPELCTIWSVDRDGRHQPTAGPSVVLADRPGVGLYFVTLGTRELSRNLDVNSAVQLTVAPTRGSSWARTIGFRRASNQIGVRLIGTAGRRRKATAAEVASAQHEHLGTRRDRPGANSYVREIRFRSVHFEHVPANDQVSATELDLQPAIQHLGPSLNLSVTT